MNIDRLKELEPVETEEEYWKVYKIFKREINKMSKQVLKLVKEPSQYLEDYETLLNEGVRLNIITEEFKQKKITQLYTELSSPSRFKQDVKDYFNKQKDKFKRKK